LENTLKEPFDWRPFLAILYSIFVFQPALIWIYLQTFNITLVSGVIWATLLLFVELSRLSGRPLSRQEASVIFIGSGIVTTFIIPVTWTYQIYLRNSPISNVFHIQEEIPPFYAPASSRLWETRTFLDSEWFFPITVSIAFYILNIITNLSTGLLTFHIFWKTERLDFPVHRVGGEACIVLTEREPDKLQAFALCSLVGLLYSAIQYTVPFITEALGFHWRAIPIPWIDLNNYVQLVLPGASFGVGTDILSISWGFIIPFNVVISMFFGSFAFYFIGNALLIHLGLTQFSEIYRYGMNIATAWQRSMLYAWASPIIGIAAGIGVIPLIQKRDIVRKATSAMSKGKGANLWFLLAGFLGGTIGSTALALYLAPTFPAWPLLLVSTGWSFIFVLACARSFGVTGVGFDIPNINYFAYLASGYTGYDIWFVPVVVETSGGGASWCAQFVMADIPGTSPRRLLKPWLLSLPIALMMAFVWVSSFWKLAPIPSHVYPGADIYYPAQAIIQSLWITRSLETFRPLWITMGFILSSVILLIIDYLHFPISMVGVAAGSISPIPATVAIMIGALIGKVLRANRLLGKENFEKYRVMMVAGIAAGESIAVVIGSAIVIIIRSLWFKLY